MAMIKENMEKTRGEEVFPWILDKGIDDMEKGWELPLEEAFERITDLRNIRRKELLDQK